MAMTGAGQRVEKYTMKVIPARISSFLTANKPAMVARMSAVVDRQVEIEGRVRGILATTSGFTIPDCAFFQGFAKKANTLFATYGGGGVLDGEVDSLLDLYVAYGLNRTVMLQVLNEVFAYTPPA
jgi:hypothetical protein